MALLTCEDLSLGYEGKPILEHVSFRVEAGDYLCIVGENGSGKSTLIKTILGLRRPLHGKICAGDRSAGTGGGKLPPSKRLKRSEIGYLPQQTVVQRDFPASVLEIVRFGCQGRQGLRPFYSKADKQLAMENIRRMGLEKLVKRCYRDLSGGQQQRVLLARALCATRRLLLLDEPVSGLDPRVTAEMYQLISDLNRKEGVTIIMVSHDLSAALQYATHILHVGAHVWFGTRDDYLQSKVGSSFLRQGGMPE